MRSNTLNPFGAIFKLAPIASEDMATRSNITGVTDNTADNPTGKDHYSHAAVPTSVPRLGIVMGRKISGASKQPYIPTSTDSTTAVSPNPLKQSTASTGSPILRAALTVHMPDDIHNILSSPVLSSPGLDGLRHGGSTMPSLTGLNIGNSEQPHFISASPSSTSPASASPNLEGYHAPSFNSSLTSSADHLTTSRRKGSLSSVSMSSSKNKPQKSPLIGSTGIKPSGSAGEKVMQFLGKMSLSKERMGKLVQQSKDAYQKGPLTASTTLQATPFEGMFGVPLRVILRYQSELGNQIPSILNSIFSVLESSHSLSTPHLFSASLPSSSSPTDVLDGEAMPTDLESIIRLYNSAQEVDLRHVPVHTVTELLFEFFRQLPEPIISIEFYETLLNYYQTETLLHLMIRKLNQPNKTILCRLIKYLKDVLVYSNFNEATMELVVDRFHRFLLRPSNGTISQVAMTDAHQSTVRDILSLFITQAETLFQTPEERSTSEDALILYIEEVAATQKTSSTGNLWLFQKQIVWRPKVNPTGEQDLVLLFSSILKVVLAPSGKKEQRILPNFTVYCSSDTKTVITFGFQSSATCKLVYSFINAITKNIAPAVGRSLAHKLDMFSLDLEALPNEIKQLKSLQELNLNRNKFRLLPGDLARLTSLRTISIEENNLAEISGEMADFLGSRLSQLENVTLSSNILTSLPPLHTWAKLKTLNISNNSLTALPIDIFQGSNNQIDDQGIPRIITSTRLRSLDLRCNKLTSIPEGIVNLLELQVLALQDNMIQELSANIQKLTALTELNLNGNQISVLPPQLLLLTSLKKLYLDNNQLQTISSAIHRMHSLIELRLTNNNISRLPPGIVALKKLVSLELGGNRPLKDSIPEKYITRGKEGIFAYFGETMRANTPCYRTRIIVVGEKAAGKSSIIRGLKKAPKAAFAPGAASPTSVLDIVDWPVALTIDGSEGRRKKAVTIHTWEFEGLKNEVCHVFFVPGIIYMVVFSLAMPAEAALTSYLHRIYLRDRRATIFMVGTRADEVTRKVAEKTVDRLAAHFRTLFPTLIINAHSVAATRSDGEGMSRLRRDVKGVVAKLPILKQTYPASFLHLEDYLKEEAHIMAPPLVTRKNLVQMAKTMDLHTEPHFTQLKSLFNALGSIVSFEQFIRLEPGASPMKTEMIALNPTWTARALASLLSFDPHSALPFHVGLEADDDSYMPGILSHRVLRYVWNPNSPYHVPERFFSLFLSLLESNDLAINIYTILGLPQSASSASIRKFSSVGMIKFTASAKVRNGRSSSFNARLGWALVSSLLPLPPAPVPIPFACEGVWEAYPERSDVQQYARRFVLDFTPHGLFGRLLSRLMQICHLLKCWHNIAVLVPDTMDDSMLTERVLVVLDAEKSTIEIVSRFTRSSSLSVQIYSIVESLVTKWYKVSYRTTVVCSHCTAARASPPYLFRLEEVESAIVAGESCVPCRRTIETPVTPRSSNTPSTPRGTLLSRKDSKTQLTLQQMETMSSPRRESKGASTMIERKDSSNTVGESSVAIKSLLLDHALLMELVPEIDFREVEVTGDTHPQEGALTTSVSMGMYEAQFVNLKLFNTPSTDNAALSLASNHVSASKVLAAFRHEALSLHTLRHPNVLSIIGISLTPLAIITENPTFGNKASTMLSEYIQDRHKHPEITWRLKLKIALDIANAMENLQSQSPPYLITNLSSSNIMLEKSTKVEEGIIAKISDFSSLSILPGLFPTDTSPKSWHAPEILQKVNYHELTDVYSYGIILYELLTRSIAFQDHERFSSMVVNGQRPSIPPDCLPSFGDLIKDCWAGDPLNRPTFSDIITQLTLIKKELETKENTYNSLASDTNIYSNLPLPSGGSVIYRDRLFHFGGWTSTGKPHSTVYSLNLATMVLEEKLNVVLQNRHYPTYKTFFAHMQSEFNDENLLFYEAIKAFKCLPSSTPEEREVIVMNAKKIYLAFIGESAPREVNLPGTLKIELKRTIDTADGQLSVNVFNDTLSYVLSSIEDSFHRFKFSAPSCTKNAWMPVVCRGPSPPPMVGHSSILWNGNLLIVGGWFDGARQLNQVHLLNLESFEWTLQPCRGEIPPSSSGALSASLHGDYLLIYYERADSVKQQMFRLSLDSFVWIGLKLSPTPQS
eukprot:gene12619-14810_t